MFSLCVFFRDIPLRLGLPDIMNSSCAEPESCEGYALSQAEACLPHAPSDTDEVPGTEWIENDCDPRYAYGVWICGNDGSYNPALPEAWAKGTAMMDCGW